MLPHNQCVGIPASVVVCTGEKNTPFSAPEDPSETETVKRTDPTPHRSNGRSMSDHSDPDSHDFMSDHSNPDPHGFLVWDETREEAYWSGRRKDKAIERD